MISSRNQELKVEAAKIISMINNCDIKNILFIDDIVDNIERFNDAGINALLPSDIEQFIIGGNKIGKKYVSKKRRKKKE